MDLTRGLVYNTLLLVAVSVIYAGGSFSDELPALRKKLVIGFLAGVAGVGIMANPIPFTEGVFFDTRSILLASSGLFFGFLPTAVAAVMTSAFRVFQGGAGVWMGLSVILSSSMTGLFWRSRRFETLRRAEFSDYCLELYLFGLVVHGIMVASMLLLGTAAGPAIRVVALPMMAVYPLGTVLVGWSIRGHMIREDAMGALRESERKFELYIQKAPYGVFVSDGAGRYLQVNEEACRTTGYGPSELTGMHLLDLIAEEDRESAGETFARLLENGFSETTVGFVRKDGERRLWQVKGVAVSPERFLGFTRDVTEDEARRRRIEHMSYHDALTGLFNRRYFNKVLKRHRDRGELPMALILADVNGLKLMNDAFGHAFGDELLRRAAGVMREVCGPEVTIARVGGDEFVVLLPGVGEEAAYRFMTRMREGMAGVEVRDVALSVSFGLGIHRDGSESLEEVFKRAEDRMYRNKLFESAAVKGNMVSTMLKTLYEKSPREEAHSVRVSSLCGQLGETLGLPYESLNELKTAGLLHDIGKIALDEALLGKPGSLDSKEWSLMKTHPDVGYRILGSVPRLASAAEAVLAHHERWDGKGYPKGLKGDEIPRAARIIALADAYDAMTGPRTYREVFSPGEALEEIRKNAGTQFDPEMAEVFIGMMGQGVSGQNR